MIDKDSFIKLAKAYQKQEAYTSALLGNIKETAKKHGQITDFLGLPFDYDNLSQVVLDILGDDFSYYHYDCAGDFRAFNKNTIFADGSHPKVKNLSDLYDFSLEYGCWSLDAMVAKAKQDTKSYTDEEIKKIRKKVQKVMKEGGK